MYVAELLAQNAGAIEKLAPDGRSLARWKDAEIQGAGELAVDHIGTIYLADSGADRVLAFSPQGKKVGSWGVAGSAAGQLHAPGSLAVDATGAVYVVDSGNNRIQALSR